MKRLRCARGGWAEKIVQDLYTTTDWSGIYMAWKRLWRFGSKERSDVCLAKLLYHMISFTHPLLFVQR